MGIRVYELASRLGLTNKQMLELLWQYEIDTKNHMSLIEGDIEKIIEEILLKTTLTSDLDFISSKNNSSLKSIEINGLFEKYDYKLNFNDGINIFIAENGFGKTTILNIIIATLKQDIKKLKRLPFKSVKITVNDKIIEIDKEELNVKENDIRHYLMKIKDFVPDKTYRNMMNRYLDNNEFDFEEYNHIIRRYSNEKFIRNHFETIDCFAYTEKLEKLKTKFNIIEEAVKEEVLYFPTYRRIEEELDSFVKLDGDEKKYLKAKLDESSINFGMEDVENIINDLTEKLKQDAFQNYSIMNAEILDDLLSNKVELSQNDKRKIDIEKIQIIVGRIGEKRIKQIDKLMNFINRGWEVENKNFLEYYLLKLINIYESQKLIDEKIKNFRDVCNRYLVNKELIYDEVLTEVKLIDKDNKNKTLRYSQLSSGEKQILSLFARLYLKTSKPVLFIIDEPELSLSIVWQKRLLEDILNSKKVALLIATTHSPYIFKNKFRTFAKELAMLRNTNEEVL